MLKNVLTGLRKGQGTSASRAARKFLQEADAARDAGSWPEAARLYRRYLGIIQGDAAIWTQLGHALKEAGHLGEAEASYRTGLAFDPQNAELFLQLGHLLKSHGRLEEAEQSYRRSSALDPTLGAEAEIAWLNGRVKRPKTAAMVTAEAEPAEDDSEDPEELHRLADVARDRGAVDQAIRYYGAFLELRPDEGGTWVQLGHMLRDSGDLDGAVNAYRTAIKLDETDADAHFQLGHVLWRRSDVWGAHASFRHSLRHAFLPYAIRTMAANGFSPAYTEVPERAAGGLISFIEITDLITVLRHSTTISGIQRVQVNLVRQLVSADDTRVVFWQSGLLWSVRPDLVIEATALFENVGALESRQKVLQRMMDQTELVRPRRGDVFIVTGAFWISADPAVDHAKLKHDGVRLGAYVHDFIPMTNPEFIPQVAVDDFSQAMAELMVQLDFALTNSVFVCNELKRLRSAAGLPTIPVEVVPLAHELPAPRLGETERWSTAIAHLKNQEFVLCVGSISAHKNHIMAVQAWRLLLQMGVEPPKLILAGRRGNNIGDLVDQLKTSMDLGGRVQIIEGLDDSAVATLYRNCLFTLFPSFVEGWGLPVGEALAYGKVCLASNTTSIPEVGGDFVIPIDPYNARGTAQQIAALLADRPGLAKRERRVRSDFQIRSWAEFGTLFVSALAQIKTVQVRDLVVLHPSKLLLTRRPHRRWTHGTQLPASEITVGNILSRSVLASGWHSSESWGTWMNGHTATVVIPTIQTPGTLARVAMQFRSVAWPRRNRLIVETANGQSVTMDVPEADADFLMTLESRVGSDRTLSFKLRLEGGLTTVHGEPRALGVGLRRLMFVEAELGSEHLSAGMSLLPAALSGSSGHAIEPFGLDGMIEAVRRQSVLVNGWKRPEAWGTWMDGTEAKLTFAPASLPGSHIRVMLRFRSTTPAGGILSIQADGGGSPVITVLPPGRMIEVTAGVSGKVATDGRFSLLIETSPSSARVGIVSLAWSGLGNESERLALLESALFGTAEHAPSDADLLGRNASFVVAGHLAGTYSLAAVNRRMATALETALPGQVQVLQVEGDTRPDMEGIPGPLGTKLRTMAYRGLGGTGPQIMICGHWPVQPPPEPSDLPLAYVFWEESVVPHSVIQTLNDNFKGVLSPARFVSKALIDSGLRIPVRLVGYAPDLAPFFPAGEERLHAEANATRPFTFLHVSSCFPRKGVDVLLAAYAKAFSADAPVRLVIKGFPNPHNDVATQLERLRASNPSLADIELIEAELGESALVELYRTADCVVLPTRGEGFNIPAAEALASGLPVLATGMGGHVDFLHGKHARLLDYRLGHSRSHVRSMGSIWAEPDVDDLSSALQVAFTSRQDTAASALAVARQIDDSGAWAERIQSAALDLLTRGKRRRPRVAWVSTWMVQCGIAEYSRMLLNAYGTASDDVVVLCDDRTENAAIAQSPVPVRHAWELCQTASMDRLARNIEEIDADVVLVQHHQGLLPWPDLPLLLDDPRLRNREVVITIHNVQQIADESHEVHERLFRSLSRISRIIVHSASDLNRLKDYGLVENVTLIPQGAISPPARHRPSRTIRTRDQVIVGSYGFFLPHKGFDRLIEAFQAIRNVYPKARLRLVASEYPAKASAETIASCRGIAEQCGVADAIDWHTAYLSNEESLKLMQGCDLLVLPYQHTREASSAAVRIALAAQVPVLVTPLPIFEELGAAVLRLDGTDREAIANGVLWALGEKKVLDDLVQASAEWLEENSWERVGKRLSGMLEGLVAQAEA